MAYVDPWGNFSEAAQGLGSTLASIPIQRRQEEIQRMAKAEFDEKMSERATQEETRQGLAGIYAQGKELTPVPGKSAAELMDAPGYQTVQGLPTATPEQQVPKYSTAEIQAKAADFLTSSGDWAGLKALESAMDITSKIDQRTQTMMSNMFKSVKEMRSAGVDNASIKLALKDQANNINRINGQQVINPDLIDKMNINAAGDLLTKDLGGGQLAIMVAQPNGTVTVQVVDTTKQQRVENTKEQINTSKERIAQGWARLNPRLQAELEAAKASGKEESKTLIKGKDDYYNAQDANANLLEAEALLDKDPGNVAGVTAKFRGFIGSIDPALEEALGSGDRKTFERVMMNNADTFKKLLGPQISNADANLMFKLAGATASSPAEIRATIKVLRKRNDTTINTFEKRQSSVGQASPATKPYTKTERTIKTMVSPAVEEKVNKAVREGQAFTFQYNGKRVTGRKTGGKLIYDSGE